MAAAAETAAMREALALARTPGVPPGPNPRVGCVLLDPSGAVVGTGFHRGAGTAHAEVVALRDAGTAARGGTAVVTLEPCNHTGRTGPCVSALLSAGVARVVFGQPDRSPDAGGGAQALRTAGVDVEAGVLAQESAALNRAWTFAVESGRPFVTWKFAATLDGRSAAADGSSRWITSAPARQDVHRLRAQCDAVVVGTGTVLADDPALTVRDASDDPSGHHHQPLRAVVGRRDVPVGARVRDRTAETVLLRTRDPSEALAALFDRGCRHALLEGGPTLAGAFLRSGAVDEVVAYLAPSLLGAGAPALGDLGVRTVDEAVRLDVDDVTRVGTDVRVTATPCVDRG